MLDRAAQVDPDASADMPPRLPGCGRRIDTLFLDIERIGAGGCDTSEPIQYEGPPEEDHACREPGDHANYAFQIYWRRDE